MARDIWAGVVGPRVSKDTSCVLNDVAGSHELVPDCVVESSTKTQSVAPVDLAHCYVQGHH